MCSAPHVKRGAHVTDGEGVALNERTVIDKEPGRRGIVQMFKFLGVFEGLKQEQQMQFLQCAAKSYLQHMSLIWTSPLSDYNRIIASNTYTLPVLAYLI